MIRKIICCFLTVLMCGSMLGGCGSTSKLERYHYTEEDIEAFYGTLSASATYAYPIFEPELVGGIDGSFLIVRGTILDNGSEFDFKPHWKNHQEYFSDSDGCVTFYTLDVAEVWFGDESPRRILVSFGGKKDTYLTKPRQGDQVILFLKEPITLDGYVKEFYIVSAMPEDAWIINPPDDEIIAMHPLKESLYQGESPEELRAGIESTLIGIAEGTIETSPIKKRGKALTKYVEEYDRK